MSTVNATASAQTAPKVVLPGPTPLQRTEPKVTAAQIENGCPARLQEIGRKITKRLGEAREQAKHVDDHVIAINNLVAEAKEICFIGGFDKFRELFCPQLGKSQAYVRLDIAAGKTTLVEHRTKERERKQMARANQKAAAAKFRDVPDKSGLEAPSAFTENDGHEATNLAPEPAKPRRAVAPGDEALIDFSARVMELIRRTAKREPERFSATAVPADDLARLGNFLTDLENLKKSDAAKPARVLSVKQHAMRGPDAAIETQGRSVA
jgi:hypothetical protein